MIYCGKCIKCGRKESYETYTRNPICKSCRKDERLKRILPVKKIEQKDKEEIKYGRERKATDRRAANSESNEPIGGSNEDVVDKDILSEGPVAHSGRVQDMDEEECGEQNDFCTPVVIDDSEDTGELQQSTGTD